MCWSAPITPHVPCLCVVIIYPLLSSPCASLSASVYRTLVYKIINFCLYIKKIYILWNGTLFYCHEIVINSNLEDFSTLSVVLERNSLSIWRKETFSLLFLTRCSYGRWCNLGIKNKNLLKVTFYFLKILEGEVLVEKSK